MVRFETAHCSRNERVCAMTTLAADGDFGLDAAVCPKTVRNVSFSQLLRNGIFGK